MDLRGQDDPREAGREATRGLSDELRSQGFRP